MIKETFHIRKATVSILLLCSLIMECFAGNFFNRQIYDCFIKGQLEGWRPVILQLEDKSGKTLHDQLELLNYYYGFTGYLIGEGKDTEAEKYINKADRLCRTILQTSPGHATVYAYMGSFLGFQIGMSKRKALSLGPRSIEYIDKSLELDPDNMQGYLEKGNSSYYTPKAFGGSKEKAIRYYSKAIRLMEGSDLTQNNWLYLNALTLLAQAYEKTRQTAMAEATYKKILNFEPGFVHVRDILYPAFKKSIL